MSLGLPIFSLSKPPIQFVSQKISLAPNGAIGVMKNWFGTNRIYWYHQILYWRQVRPLVPQKICLALNGAIGSAKNLISANWSLWCYSKWDGRWLTLGSVPKRNFGANWTSLLHYKLNWRQQLIGAIKNQVWGQIELLIHDKLNWH